MSSVQEVIVVKSPIPVISPQAARPGQAHKPRPSVLAQPEATYRPACAANGLSTLNRNVLAAVLIVLAVVAAACTGAGGASPGPSQTAAQETPTAAAQPSAPSRDAPTPQSATARPAGPTPTPRPLTRETALQAVVQFAVDARLADLTVLESFTGGFKTEILGDGVSLTQAEYDRMLAVWQDMAGRQTTTLAALQMLSLNVASAGPAGRPGGVAAPARGVVDSAREFFDWMSGSGKRSRERIELVSNNMSEGERQELFNELKATAPESTGGAIDAAQFFQKLKRGELDASAPRIHSDLLLASASSTTAGKYSELAQDKGLLTKDIVVEEGREGLARGAKFEVDASFAALEGQFPGLTNGKEYADKAGKFLDQIKAIADDPGQGIVQVVSEAVAENAAEQLKEHLGEEAAASLEAELDQFEEAVGSLIADALGSDADAETAVLAAEGIGLIQVAADGYAAAVALREGPGDGSEMVVYVPGAANPMMELPEGSYSVQTFDKAGKLLGKSKVTSEAGWEQVADAKNGSERMADARIRAARTPTPRPPPTPIVPWEWVLSEVVVNKDKDPLRANNPGEYYVGQYIEWKAADGKLTQHIHSVFRGVYQFDWTFNYAFGRPPERLRPGQEFMLTVDATSESTQEHFDGGYPSAEFQFYPRTGPTLIVAWNRPSGTLSQKFTAPTFRGQKYEVGAILWNCAPCDVTYVYTAKDLPRTPVPTPTPRPVEAAAARAVECADLKSEAFKSICEGYREAKTQYESLQARVDPNACRSPSTEDLRQQCAWQAAVESGDPERCDELAGPYRFLCRVDIAEATGDIEIVAQFGDEGFATLGLLTGDLRAIARVKDDAVHDRAVSYAVANYLQDILMGEPDRRVAPASYCGQVRGGWADETDYPDDDDLYRNQCENLLGMVRAIQLNDPAECDRMDARFVPHPLLDVEEYRGGLVNECRLAYADFNLLASR